MLRLEMRNCNAILTDRQQQYQYYHQLKLTNMNVTGLEILSCNKSQIIEQVKFTYSPLGKAFKKQKQLKINKKNKQRL